MDKKFHSYNPEIWGGIECTINRIGDEFKDQLTFSGHYSREDDVEKISALGFKTIRYPVLWELHEPIPHTPIDWSWAQKQLTSLQQKNITPIIGLVHHGSGPAFTNLLDDNFATALASYAEKVATQFPWIEYYTPVNEPLTTARFSGLYGLWYPHLNNDISFARMLLNQLKGVILCMKAIKKINPNAKLIQTEDLGKTYSSPYLQFQANFENERRWLTFDLLCGKVAPEHSMWKYFSRLGIPSESLQFFLDNPSPPDIIGVNHYITSERFLDEEIKNYPPCTYGGNELQVYADVEAIRVKHDRPYGLKILLKEVWERYDLPIAITEVHLSSHREEQAKWFYEVWNICCGLKKDGVNIRAVTAWALLGSFGWNKLLTAEKMEYETGVFDVRSGSLRPTIMVELIQSLIQNNSFGHPVLHTKGWWQRNDRFLWNYFYENIFIQNYNCKPLLIIGRTGTLGKAFARVCRARNIHHYLITRQDVDIRNASMVEKIIEQYHPWAIVNAAGYVRVDDAEEDIENCMQTNCYAAEILAKACKKNDVQFLTFSSDLVFDGANENGYYENDPVNPLNVYGKSKAMAEHVLLTCYPESLVVRTSAFFGPWDKHNFVYQVIETLVSNQNFLAANDIFISPTYVPDLVNVCLDLLLDKEKGIWHLANNGQISWADFAFLVAKKAGLNSEKITATNSKYMNWKAQRPFNSVLKSSNGKLMPSIGNAVKRYLQEREVTVEEIVER